MRRIRRGLIVISVLAVAFATIGCNSDGGGAAPKQEMQNPTGQPRDEQEQQMQQLQQQGGESAKRQMEAAAKAQAEAKARTGGK